jgi:holin-like protein
VKKMIIAVFQLSILILIHQIGNFIVRFTGLPIPGNVLGMLILFLLLWSRILPLHWVEGISTILIKHLSFFFIPISVGIMTLGTLLWGSGLKIIFILLISSFIGLIFSGGLSQIYIRKREGVKVESRHHSL